MDKLNDDKFELRIKADFHSVARSASLWNLIGCSKKRSQKEEINPTFFFCQFSAWNKGKETTISERATFCTEWKSALSWKLK